MRHAPDAAGPHARARSVLAPTLEPSPPTREREDGPKLVIVESPAKARTVGKFLGRGYTVKASIGHIRDLPANRMGVDVEHDFEPRYVIPEKKKDVVHALREDAKKASEFYLATDPDREGEAISWHLKEAAGARDRRQARAARRVPRDHARRG